MAAPDIMTTPKAGDEDEDDDLFVFVDAADEFPFHDCLPLPVEPSRSTPASEVSVPGASTAVSVPSSVLRRRRRRSIGGRSKVAAGNAGILPRERNVELYPRLEEEEESGEIEREVAGFKGDDEPGNSGVESMVTEEVSLGVVGGGIDSDVEERVDVDGDVSLESSSEFGTVGDDGLLVYAAGLIIKAIGIQLYVLIMFFKFPFKVFYISCLFFIDPFGTVQRMRNSFVQKLFSVWNAVWAISSSYLGEWFGESRSLVQFLMRYGWGLFAAGYVCVVLFSLLGFAIIGSGFMMGVLVEKPVKIVEKMNFDYTKGSPVAYMPIVSCDGIVECAGKCEGMVGVGSISGGRVVLPRQKLAATVSLTLPESEYNKNLGIFQVRIDFLSGEGKIIASRRRPCMLHFKSELIRLLLTMLKIAPLITGYFSESQILDVKFKGFTKEDGHTTCVRLVIEQRAEFPPGAGIPEIYDASLTVESELPFLKRVLWCWRRTVFIWLTIMLFVMELIFALICCRPVIFPRTTPRNAAASNGSVRSPPTAQ